MTVSLFLTLLTMFSTVTSLLTEFIKKFLDEKGKTYSSNILVAIIGCIVGVCGTGIYYILYVVEFNLINIVCMILMGLASSMGAMLGYDKVAQTIKQLNINK